MAYINIFDPNRGVYVYELTKTRTVIGRKRALSDCVINDSTVSRAHVEIILQDDTYIIKDLKSSAGMVINKFPTDVFKLTDGLNVQLGQIVIEFKEGKPEKKFKVKGTDMTLEQIKKSYSYLPSSIEVHGRFIAVDAATIFYTGDTVSFGKDGVKLIVPEMLLDEYNVLELKIVWPGGQERSFFTEVVDFSKEEKCVYLKFHKVDIEKYNRIIHDNECLDWILLQVAVV